MILETIFRGELYPAETVVLKSPEYRKANEVCGKLMEELANRLSKEDYALVGELHEQQLIAQSEENEEHFKYGFSVGLLVQQEAYKQAKRKTWQDLL